MPRIKEFPLPDLGEGLTEGEILRWLVTEGEIVELNQPLVEIETAKAAVEIPAKWAGRVARIFHAEGEVVGVGAPIVAIDTQPDAPPAQAPEAPAARTAVLVGYGPRTGSATRRPRRAAAPTHQAAAPTQAAAVPAVPAGPPEPAGPPKPAPPTETAEPAGYPTAVLCKPPVRKLARDLGVELRLLTGSGPQGSVTRDDVLAAAAHAGTSLPRAGAPADTAAAGTREQRIQVRGVRRLTAENVVASAFTAPHVTEFLTVDVTRAMKSLDRLREQPEWRGVRISPLLLTAKAVLMAVRRHPMINSTWAGDEIVVKEYVNLGIAAATDRGLIVPNIKDAGRLSLRELADQLNTLVETAKAGRTAPPDMSGGTLTITNVGVFGVDTGTPLLPPGESAILALGAVRQMPWAHRGKVRIRQVTTLGLSFDHRVIDGELGSRFLRDVGDFLTDPGLALLAWG